MRRFRPLLCLAFVLVGCGATFAEPSAPESTGEAPRLLIGVGSHGQEGEGELLRTLGSYITRVTYYVANDSPDARARFSVRLNDLESHGLDAMIVMHDFGADTVKMVRALTKAFPARTFQILNEADAHGFTGTQYASLMQRIVEVAPTAHFVSMGLASNDATLRTFVRDYQNANGPTLDAWAVHCYGSDLGHAVTMQVANVRSVVPQATVWVTETGIDRAQMGAAAAGWSQAKVDSVQTQEAIKAINAARVAKVARLYFYQLFDATDDGFGFLRADAKTLRPVAQTLNRLQ